MKQLHRFFFFMSAKKNYFGLRNIFCFQGWNIHFLTSKAFFTDLGLQWNFCLDVWEKKMHACLGVSEIIFQSKLELLP